MAEDFSKIFAQNGTVVALSDMQYLQGFAYLGSLPPSREEFNWLFQRIDTKLKSLNDAQSGEITVVDTAAPPDYTATAAVLIGNLFYMIKQITGKENGRINPATTLEAAGAHAGNTNNPHSVTAAQTGAAYIVAESIGTNGYRKWSDGFIEQWGHITAGDDSYTAVTFPIAFPTAVLHASSIPIINTGGAITGEDAAGGFVGGVSLTGMSVAASTDATRTIAGIYWSAAGY